MYFRRRASAIALLLVALVAAGRSGTSAAAPGAPRDATYRVVRWSTAQGLPQNSVNDMVLLPDGELWVATFGGLARFDGDAFHVVDIASDEGMPANRVLSLAVAGRDSFWFLTQQGHLGRVQGGRASLLVGPPNVRRDALSLFVDRAGRAYCKFSDGSIWQTDGLAPWRLVLASPGSRGMLNAFAETDEGQVWAGYGSQIVDLTTGTPGATMDVPASDADIFRRPGGGLWLGLTRGIGQFTGGQVEAVRVVPAIDEQVRTIVPDGTDTLWVAMASRIARLDRNEDGSWRQTPIPLEPSLRPDIRALVVDREGNAWVGTNGHGLFRLHLATVRRYGIESGLKGATALATDGAGGAFVVTGCEGQFHISAQGTVTPFALRDPAETDDHRSDTCTAALAPVAGGQAFVRARSRLYRVSRPPIVVRRVPIDLPDDEGAVLPTSDGSLWVVSRSGIVRLVTLTGVVLRELRLAGPLESAALGPHGALWVGGDGLVVQVGPSGTREFGVAERVPRGLVRDIHESADGTVWIGTYGGGLGRMRDGRVTRLSADDGLPDNAISRILDDGLGRFWISTNRGVAVVEHEEVDDAAAKRARLVPVVLGPERGIAEANYGVPAGFADANGMLWLGTIEGVAVIDATAFPNNMTPPEVTIEGVSADERPLPVGDVIRIPARTARVRISFTTFNLTYPERVRFRFRVLGTDEAWVDAGPGRSVDWTPTGPGRHQFVVEARNEDGVWSVSPTTITLDVLPAWYETAWFRVLAIVGGLAFAVLLQVVWRRRIEARHAERLRVLEEQQAAQQRVASLRTQLEHVARVALAGELAASIAHEVSQPLGAIVNNAEAGRRQLEGDEHGEELRDILGDIVADGMRASEVVRGLRGFLRRADVEAVDVDLSALVRQMLPIVRRELSEAHVQVSLALDEGLPRLAGFPVQLGQVVVNLLMNACEALSSVEGERRVVISTTSRGGRVLLSVRDNGPGLKPEMAASLFTPFVTTKPGGLGMGLAICRAIAETHGGSLRAHDAAGGGFEVTLSLPLAPAKGNVA